MKTEQLKPMVEALLMVADQPLPLDQLAELFDEFERPSKSLFREVLKQLQLDYHGRGIELIEVASGWRIQARPEYATRIARLWQERPQKYSRALMETLALIAYRQPVTRGDIEEIRGVSVSSSIMKTLLEREWVRVVGYRDVPGRPSMYATTRQFLDYFNLKTLDQLPTLSEIRELGEVMQAKQQDEIAEEEARMLAAQEEKRRQMMAAAQDHLDDESDDEQANVDESDAEGSESALDAHPDKKKDDTDANDLSFSDLTQRLDERLSESDQQTDVASSVSTEDTNTDTNRINNNRTNNPNSDEVSAQNLPPIPDND